MKQSFPSTIVDVNFTANMEGFWIWWKKEKVQWKVVVVTSIRIWMNSEKLPQEKELESVKIEDEVTDNL